MQIGAFLERSIPWRWALYWLVIPNLIIILTWPLGGPSMTNVLQLFGFSGLLVSQLPWKRVKQTLLLGMMGTMMSYYICLTFNLPIWAIQYLPEFAVEVRPWLVSIYLLGGLLFLGVVLITLRHAPRVQRFPSLLSMLVAISSIYAMSMIDDVAARSTRDSYHAVPAAGEPFHAATTMAGLEEPAAGKRNVVIIVVEALGRPTSRVEKALFDADWNRPGWRTRYDVSQGSVPYYGSTTNAEIRELCGVWGLYMNFDFAKSDCLPGRYRKAGYKTTAMHSFTGEFFDRTHWYPKLHFDRIEFASDLIKDGARPCGGMFPGACDKDVPALIARRLANATEPQMIYWLTLNSHVPVVEDQTLGTIGCRLGPAEWSAENQQLCRLFSVHHQLAAALDAMAMDPALPPTDILIVGDHMPPLFDRDSRMRFDGSHVPWILLRSKAGRETGPARVVSTRVPGRT